MRTYYEKVLNGMQRPILLVAVSIVALLSASGIAMGVTSTEGRNAGHAVKAAAAASPTSTALRIVRLTIPEGTGAKTIKGSTRFSSPVTSRIVAVNGFQLNYLSVDHHTDMIQVDVDTVKNQSDEPADEVHFVAHTTYTDKDTFSSYNGYVDVAVIANVQ